jgi:hypothetical protein
LLSFRNLYACGGIIVAVVCVGLFARADSFPLTPHARMGINLSGPADFNTEQPFVDVFHFSRAWISQRDGASWGKGPDLDCDPQGWIRKLEPGCYAQTLLCTIDGGHYPSGFYVVLYDGKGVIEVSGAASLPGGARPIGGAGRLVIKVDATKGGFFLTIRQTDPANYIRNIRVLMPGTERTYRSNPFRADFLKRWNGVACFRFMDWMMTNDAKVVHWDERPKPDDANWTTHGIPLEVMIDLCNRQKADGWFCIPHTADDDYVTHCAQLIKDRLDPTLHAYIEYSNEVWNSSFPSNHFAVEQAAKIHLGDASKPWEAGCLYYVKRSEEIFAIFQSVFGPRNHSQTLDHGLGTPSGDRLVRVLSWQAASGKNWLDGMLLGHADPSMVDALAIAPYFTLMPTPAGDVKWNTPKAAEVAGWSSDQVFGYLRTYSLVQSQQWISEAAAAARAHHVRLLAYESGQHLVGVMGAENNEAMNKVFFAANADPKMGALYGDYLTGWQKSGGDLLCAFSSVGSWSKWGSWGLLQYTDDSLTKSPKFVAVMQWAHSLGQKVAIGSAAK